MLDNSFKSNYNNVYTKVKFLHYTGGISKLYRILYLNLCQTFFYPERVKTGPAPQHCISGSLQLSKQYGLFFPGLIPIFQKNLGPGSVLCETHVLLDENFNRLSLEITGAAGATKISARVFNAAKSVLIRYRYGAVLWIRIRTGTGI